MIWCQTARSWASVHATRPALWVLASVAVVSLVFADVQAQNFGLVRLLTPVSVLLLLPTIAGVGAAIAGDNTARLPLPDPPRAVIARAGWVLSWVVLAIAAVNVGQSVGAGVDWLAVARNVTMATALGLFVVRLGFASLAWLPPLAYTIVCMMFGFPRGRPDYYWWAVIMERDVTTAQLYGVGLVFLAVLAFYVWPRRPTR